MIHADRIRMVAEAARRASDISRAMGHPSIVRQAVANAEAARVMGLNATQQKQLHAQLFPAETPPAEDADAPADDC